jgi:hypothetical protein
MGRRVRSSMARCLAVLVPPFLVLGVMAGMAPASAASSLSRESDGRTQADAGALAAVPASLRAAIGASLGTSAAAAGYSRRAELTASNRAPDDKFGYSVALSGSGTTALVGADDHGLTTGAAYVFMLRHGTWSQTAELTAPHPEGFDQFGYSVALSAAGTTALVGAVGRDSYTGAAYVFTLRGGTWSRTAELTASHGAPNDSFGYSVALSALGSTALVAATGIETVYVFRLRGGTWSQTARLTTSPDGGFDDAFGTSVALSAPGTTALVGNLGHNSDTGAAYVFTLRGGTWSQTAELTASRRALNDAFGASVALSAPGSTALVGADGRNSSTGAAYVFRLRGGTWSQTAELTASRGVRGDDFGASVALSESGATALVAAQAHSATGAAFVFTGIP